ncbi:hypothetical protein BDV96DRAFT_692888 [Lophiotrema nucula]|uniref:Uncharacterized protein n=1 Tax=Lophiotrema nucula TaxID=690887 RepID=A0A6A5YNE1_9PLEO|nr:hypothetical protein BDV96DRAFT_692888 [Lophiotrema nucula]
MSEASDYLPPRTSRCTHTKRFYNLLYSSYSSKMKPKMSSLSPESHSKFRRWSFLFLAVYSILILPCHADDDDPIPTLDPADFPDNIKNIKPSNPDMHYVPRDPPKPSEFEAIVFYDNNRCTDEGSAIAVHQTEFDDKYCATNPKADSGMSHYVDLEDAGAGFIVKNGQLNGCQLHWYTGEGCADDTHAGFMVSLELEDGCNHPRDEKSQSISELRSFAYVCEGSDVI